MASLNLNYFLTPNAVTLGVRASSYDLGDGEETPFNP